MTMSADKTMQLRMIRWFVDSEFEGSGRKRSWNDLKY
jgi:hypothetical protein